MKRRYEYGGYAGQLLRIDLTKEKIKKEELPKELCRFYIGGRGRDAKILFDELKPSADPLGPENILCISAGPLTGLLGPTTGRLNVATKSPLTNIYGNSNAGANFGPELKYAGYDGVIIKGRAKKPLYIYVDNDNIELRDANHLWGKGVFETTEIVQEECDGYDTKIAAIGPAAEKGVLFGSLIFDYWDAAGRIGTGSVMASKNLKAIGVRGDGELRVANNERYMNAIIDGWLGIINDSGFKTMEHSALGTSVCVNWGNAQGWLVTRNFREGEFESADDISGEEFRDRLSTKEPPIPGGRACLSCPNRCKRFGKVEKGKYAGTKGNIEFEGVGAFGSKCGVGNLDAVFHAYMLSNDYGMDCISCGNMIATLMELYEDKKLSRKDLDGLDLHFGNENAMIEMVHRIANMQGKTGRLGAMGTDRALRALNADERYFTAVKGSDTICCDPRASKGFGFGYAVASRGSDHLRAHAVFEMLRMPKEVGSKMFGSPEATKLGTYGGKVNLVIYHEDLGAVTDSLGTCRFMHASYYAQYPIPELLAELKGKKEVNSIKYHEWLSAATGIEFSYNELLKVGKRIINLERALNTRFGIRRKDDRLPKRFTTEPLKSGRAKGEVFDPKIFKKMLDEYYEARGWDKNTGLLLKSGLDRLNMKDVAKKLSAEKLIAVKSRSKKKGR